MLDTEAVGQCIRAGLAAAAILLAIHYVVRPTLVEVFRQRIFRLRRELFLLRVDGEIAADDPAYQAMMRSMNGLLRYAESISFGRMLVSVVFGRKPTGAFNAALAKTPRPAADRLASFRVRQGYEVVRHMVYTSPLLWGLLIVAVPLFHLLSAMTRTRAIVKHIVERVALQPSVRRVQHEASEMLPDDLARAA